MPIVESDGVRFFVDRKESEAKSCIGWYQFILTVSLDGHDLALIIMNGWQLVLSVMCEPRTCDFDQ